MQRWSNYGKLDTQLASYGDSRFIGMNMLLDRPLLPEGTLARSENKRLKDGVARTRPGTIQPGDFHAAFEDVIVGSAIYSNPNGDEIMLVATANASYVWALQYGKDPVKINLFAGQSIGLSVAVEFVQAFEKVLLLRRPIGALPPLVWDGVDTNTFDPIALSPTGLTLIPATWHGEPFQNRILLYNAQFPLVPWRDQIIMTDVLDYTSYDPALQVFRVNSGESDWITRVWPYYKGAVVVFKKRTTHLLESFTVDPFLTNQRLLSSKIGCLATKCVVEVGADVVFLSEPGGIYRLSELIQDQIATEAQPVSRAIQPLIDRIFWPQANIWACAATLGEYAFFAVPIDGAGNGCNAILVGNVTNREWESYDWFDDPTFRINALHVTKYDRTRRLYGLDYFAKRINLLYEGTVDELNNDVMPVRDVIETRGYGKPDEFTRFDRTALALATSNPKVTVTAITDGVNEGKVITDPPLTLDRLSFYVHGKPNFDPNMDDPLEPRREDYSLDDINQFAGQDFETIPVGPITTLPSSGSILQGPKQEALVRLPVRVNGRWVSLKIENNSGTCDVLAAGVEGRTAIETRTAA